MHGLKERRLTRAAPFSFLLSFVLPALCGGALAQSSAQKSPASKAAAQKSSAQEPTPGPGAEKAADAEATKKP